MNNRLTVIIPSKNEKFLQKTILDVLEKATGDIEIYPVLDGYEPPKEELVDHPQVHYIRLEPTSYTKKRHGINHVASITDSKYLMSLDAHCMMDVGFDEKLKQYHQDNWVQIPRRHRLDAENWCLQTQVDSRPPIDYEYLMYPGGAIGHNGLHGFKWDARTLERKDIMIDDNMTFQGSCWFMTKDYFHHLGLMQIEGYSGWGQEAEEIGFKTRRDGGRVITNKHTWYAHLHKGQKYGRMYFMSRDSLRACNAYCYNYWVNENREFFVNFVKSYMPVPGWPDDPTKWKL